jgi:thiamine-phosphate pyrophosphorylase
MWVTDRIRSDAPLPELTVAAAGHGIDLIQVRESNLDLLPLELLVRAIVKTSGPETNVVVNSDIELARKLGVGVQLPESGPSIEEARNRLGSGALVGRSVHSVEAARNSSGASYLIAGQVFVTSSKPGRLPIGIDRCREIAAASPAPVLAIGGITPESVALVLEAGAAGVAIMSPFTKIATIGARVTAYRTALEQHVDEQTVSTISATVNGKASELPAGITVAEFLAGRELHERLVVVERNGEIIKRSTFPDVVIEEGDLLEIVHFVGGG